MSFPRSLARPVCQAARSSWGDGACLHAVHGIRVSYASTAKATSADPDGNDIASLLSESLRPKSDGEDNDVSDHAKGKTRYIKYTPQGLHGRRGRPLGWWMGTIINDQNVLPGPETWSTTESQIPDVTVGGDRIYVKFGPPDVRVFPLPSRWLRDMCSCPQCKNQETGQRRINVFQCEESDFEAVDVDKCEWPRYLTVTFRDGHEAKIPGSAIIRARRDEQIVRRREGVVEVKTWKGGIARDPPSVSYEDVNAGPGMATLLHKIRTHGFAFVDDMPATPEATQQLLESIGPIRNTHYGGFYDFTSDLSSKDTAYTSEALEPHTDNTYFTEPAGLQALHLLSHFDGEGGESSLVDGFRAAQTLLEWSPKAYRELSMTGVHAHASGNEGISIQPAQAFPTFTHSMDSQKLIQVRWNNADRAGVAANWSELDAWYDAADKFDTIVNTKKNQYWFQLKPGRMLLFDNWRVMHGRSAFTGKRRMCGGYINRDDWISKFRMTNMSKEDLEASTVTG